MKFDINLRKLPSQYGEVSVMLLIIIIITLFQEDNIFGTDASLKCGPPLTDVDMLLTK